MKIIVYDQNVRNLCHDAIDDPIYCIKHGMISDDRERWSSCSSHLCQHIVHLENWVIVLHHLLVLHIYGIRGRLAHYLNWSDKLKRRNNYILLFELFKLVIHFEYWLKFKNLPCKLARRCRITKRSKTVFENIIDW